MRTVGMILGKDTLQDDSLACSGCKGFMLHADRIGRAVLISKLGQEEPCRVRD